MCMFLFVCDLSTILVVTLYTRYPIVARRAWPTGISAFRPSASREQRHLLYTRYPIVARALGRVRAWPSARASKGILHTKASCIQVVTIIRAVC